MAAPPFSFGRHKCAKSPGRERASRISLKTSEYGFSVIDPLNQKGMLNGGTLGEGPREAFLIESRSKGEDGTLRDFRGLKTGARALFYLSSGRTIERVTTSKISGLTSA